MFLSVIITHNYPLVCIVTQFFKRKPVLQEIASVSVCQVSKFLFCVAINFAQPEVDQVLSPVATQGRKLEFQTKSNCICKFSGPWQQRNDASSVFWRTISCCWRSWQRLETRLNVFPQTWRNCFYKHQCLWEKLGSLTATPKQQPIWPKWKETPNKRTRTKKEQCESCKADRNF